MANEIDKKGDEKQKMDWWEKMVSDFIRTQYILCASLLLLCLIFAVWG